MPGIQYAICVVLLVLTSIHVEAFQGDEVDPVFPWNTIWEQDQTFDSATTVKSDVAKWCRIGPHLLVLESATLANVIQTVGTGSLTGNHRDAAGGEFMVDYTDGENLTRFSSNAEMGGDTHDLDGIEIRPLTRFEREKKLPLLKLPLSFPFGSCGMSLQKLEARIGHAKIVRGKVAYSYDGKKLIKVADGNEVSYDVDGVLEAKIEQGKIVALRLAHLTTN